MSQTGMFARIPPKAIGTSKSGSNSFLIPKYKSTRQTRNRIGAPYMCIICSAPDKLGSAGKIILKIPVDFHKF